MKISDALDFAYSYPEPFSCALLNVCFNLICPSYIQQKLKVCSLKSHETHGVGIEISKGKNFN